MSLSSRQVRMPPFHGGDFGFESQKGHQFRVIWKMEMIMDFGDAIRSLKLGKRVARAGWNGKNMWLALSPAHPALPADKFWAGPNREFAEKMVDQHLYWRRLQ
jgi:hypothetical protein